MFEIGKKYKTQLGHKIRVLNRCGPIGYEYLECSDGRCRYDRSTDNTDAGRVTGTSHDFSCPYNFKQELPANYFVVRTHSHTDKQQLWKVMSRGFSSMQDALNWKEYCELSELNPKHNFFIVEIKT